MSLPLSLVLKVADSAALLTADDIEALVHEYGESSRALFAMRRNTALGSPTPAKAHTGTDVAAVVETITGNAVRPVATRLAALEARVLEVEAAQAARTPVPHADA